MITMNSRNPEKGVESSPAPARGDTDPQGNPEKGVESVSVSVLIKVVVRGIPKRGLKVIVGAPCGIYRVPESRKGG